MNKRWIVLTVVACAGICFLLLFGTASLRSEEEGAEGVIEPSKIEESDIKTIKSPVSEKGETETLVERAILVTIPEIFEEIERPPVKFYHGKHTVALEEEEEGCNVCHPKDEEGKPKKQVTPKSRPYPKSKDLEWQETKSGISLTRLKFKI